MSRARSATADWPGPSRTLGSIGSPVDLQVPVVRLRLGGGQPLAPQIQDLLCLRPSQTGAVAVGADVPLPALWLGPGSAP